jgi:hypothetical protein
MSRYQMRPSRQTPPFRSWHIPEARAAEQGDGNDPPHHALCVVLLRPQSIFVADVEQRRRENSVQLIDRVGLPPVAPLLGLRPALLRERIGAVEMSAPSRPLEQARHEDAHRLMVRLLSCPLPNFGQQLVEAELLGVGRPPPVPRLGFPWTSARPWGGWSSGMYILAGWCWSGMPRTPVRR